MAFQESLVDNVLDMISKSGEYIQTDLKKILDKHRVAYANKNEGFINYMWHMLYIDMWQGVIFGHFCFSIFFTLHVYL